MIRRRIIIEWNDDGVDTDEDCCKAFLSGEFTIEDLKQVAYDVLLKVKVEDAP